MNEGVMGLANKARKEMFEPLRKGFRNEPDLFLSLWKSHWPDPDLHDDKGEDGRETDFEILNNVTSEGKAAVYEWISSGCESLN